MDNQRLRHRPDSALKSHVAGMPHELSRRNHSPPAISDFGLRISDSLTPTHPLPRSAELATKPSAREGAGRGEF
jgi:hypothetical protein